MRLVLFAARILILSLFSASASLAAGTLTPIDSTDAPIRIRAHHVDVVINNGFARTEIQQTFFNPNDRALEALYAFPVPKSASLSELTVIAGEVEIQGEVVELESAAQIYREERDRGGAAGLATRDAYRTFEFRVSPVPAQGETRVRFVYYQPLEIDTGIGRYLYPLEDGGVDEVAQSFWVPNTVVDGLLTASIEIVSAWPIEDVRMPGLENAARVTRLEDGRVKIALETPTGGLDRDLVLYYRLADGLPGRVELVPFRPDPSRPGTFMLVVTPGTDLAPITGGADYVFVLDASGSMKGGKLATLASGVKQTIGKLDPNDRVRVFAFNDRAWEVTRGYRALTPEAVADTIRLVEGIAASGGTNLHAGLGIALDDLDPDRATNLVLVTDAVANSGVVDPKSFHDLLRRYDVRVFGFLMGNSGNWPLMRTIAQATGGFATGISTGDDLLGQVLLAKSKLTHETLHDAALKVRGVRVTDTTGALVRKVYRGEQLVLFGRYERGGEAIVTLDAKLTGADRTYRTRFDFPDVATDHPEIERLWALASIEEIEDRVDAGLLDEREAEPRIRDLGVRYQLVTDYTSLVAVGDDVFERNGVARHNRDRAAVERAAQTRRATQPPPQQRVDDPKPMFKGRAPRLGGGGGGAIDPIHVLLGLGLAGALASTRGRRPDAE